MIDAYSHLKMITPDPLADLQARMQEAAVARALLVETWSGDNYGCLQKLIEAPSAMFRVALCFRQNARERLAAQLAQTAVVALRVKTSELALIGDFGARLVATGKWLLPHAENGIGPLAEALHKLADRHPRLLIYVPHLAWPARDGEPDEAWPQAIEMLRSLPSVVIGVSAIAYFSREAFPHADVARRAEKLIGMFAAEDIVAASDYPLGEPSRYADYMRLARDWIQRIHPHWSPRFAHCFIERNA
jgi:predicted TIM-barrel fold metal-dependent hydrolase